MPSPRPKAATRRMPRSRPTSRAISASSCSTSSCRAPTEWRCCPPCGRCRANLRPSCRPPRATSTPPSPRCGAGAVDFVVKPVSPERLEVSIKNALKIEALADELVRIKASTRGELGFADLIAGSEAMTRVLELGQQGGAILDPRPDRRRMRRRQGADRPRHPRRERPRRQALRHRQLRRHSRKLVESILFGAEGSRGTPGKIRRSRPGHAVPRRDRRAAARGPGQAAARAARRRDRTRRRQAPGQGRFPSDLGDQSEPDRPRQ